MTIAPPPNAARAVDAYAALAAWLADTGSISLHEAERSALREAADAVIFGDANHEDAREDAIELVDGLLEKDRVGMTTAARLRGWLVELVPVA